MGTSNETLGHLYAQNVQPKLARIYHYTDFADAPADAGYDFSARNPEGRRVVARAYYVTAEADAAVRPPDRETLARWAEDLARVTPAGDLSLLVCNRNCPALDVEWLVREHGVHYAYLKLV